MGQAFPDLYAWKICEVLVNFLMAEFKTRLPPPYQKSQLNLIDKIDISLSFCFGISITTTRQCYDAVGVNNYFAHFYFV